MINNLYNLVFILLLAVKVW